MSIDFESFFLSATGHEPYPFQTVLATSDDWPDLIDVETGMGKTAAIITAWLYRRRYAPPAIRSATPRRLIICLPTRVLVEQTYMTGRRILENLDRLVPSGGTVSPDNDRVILKILWGGDVDNDIDRYPEMDMILIGTQDMLLSRALNRGYAMSKFRWPAHFSILNNDCLWVMDEVQLMGVGVATSAQLDAFRSKMGTIGPHRTIWMSATLDQRSIDTVDRPAIPESTRSIKLTADDLSNERICSIVNARKRVERSPIEPGKDEKKSNFALAARIKAVHEKGTMTLVILNTVSRAITVFNNLRRADLDTPVILLHSHFRPGDRAAQYDRIKMGGDIIVISTQVVEAGADISAKYLITDLGPWPSMVQRFGRCNRRGEYDDAVIEWIDPGDIIDQKMALPYEADDLLASRGLILSLKDGSPSSLSGMNCTAPAKVVPVLRRKDLLDLFDTTPDLMGNDLDVSRFVRSSQSMDVFAFWRDIDGSPSAEMPPPVAEELCSVPISGMKAYLQENKAWTWNSIDGDWSAISNAEARSLRPGMVLMLDRAKGGYSSIMGWTGSSEDIPDEVASTGASKADSQRKEAFSGRAWVTLADHTDHVVREAEKLMAICPDQYRNAVLEAAWWHDVGKAHEAFQNIFDKEKAPSSAIWAKGLIQSDRQYFTLDGDGRPRIRRFFRHELASALAYRGMMSGSPYCDLTTFLVAAHHGKVRTSLRSVPSEKGPDRDGLFARGVWDGDVIHYPEAFEKDISLDLSPVRMGASSWTSMTLRLRDDPELGPFRLSYLETLLRVADWRASSKEEDHAR